MVMPFGRLQRLSSTIMAQRDFSHFGEKPVWLAKPRQWVRPWTTPRFRHAEAVKTEAAHAFCACPNSRVNGGQGKPLELRPSLLGFRCDGDCRFRKQP
jgi:hypothetical protein